MLNHLRAERMTRVTPVNHGGTVADGNLMGLTSGYIVRADDRLPRQGRTYPWRNHQSYLKDFRALRRDVVDEFLEYR
ncbi:MAG: hypothetical protein R2698_14630 [Microthrixaceae bacterium]